MTPEKIAEIGSCVTALVAKKIDEPHTPPWRNMSISDKAAAVDDIVDMQLGEQNLSGLTTQSAVLLALAVTLKDR